MEEPLYATLWRLEDDHWWFRGRRDVLWALLSHAQVRPSPRILDAGCGTGRNLEEFARLGPIEGVDASAEAVGFCDERGVGLVTRANLESLPHDDGAFDLVLACDVIEHVPDAVAALGELRRVAAPNGRLLVTVPAYKWLWSHHDEAHQHQRRYTRATLAAHVTAAGWRPLVESHFNAILLAPIAAVRMLERVRKGAPRTTDYERTSARLNTALTWPMRMEARAIERGRSFPAGVSIGLVCAAA